MVLVLFVKHQRVDGCCSHLIPTVIFYINARNKVESMIFAQILISAYWKNISLPPNEKSESRLAINDLVCKLETF